MTCMKESNQTTDSADENSGVACSSRAPGTIPATYTPDWLAEDMVRLCGVRAGDYVLEPSAGYGALAKIAMRITAQLFCIELNETSCERLRQIGGLKPKVFHGDFMKYTPHTPIYDGSVNLG